MEQPQQQQAPQRPPGSESPDWLARLPLPDMPDLAGDDWLQDFAPAPLAAAAPYRWATGSLDSPRKDRGAVSRSQGNSPAQNCTSISAGQAC
jgi:hypothetical protein